jgi:hypothetical protein
MLWGFCGALCITHERVGAIGGHRPARNRGRQPVGHRLTPLARPARLVFLPCHWGRYGDQPNSDGPLHAEAHRLAPSPSAESRPKAAAHRRAAPSARRFGCNQRLAWISRGFGRHKAHSPAGVSPHRGPALRGLSFCLFIGEGMEISRIETGRFTWKRDAWPSRMTPPPRPGAARFWLRPPIAAPHRGTFARGVCSLQPAAQNRRAACRAPFGGAYSPLAR